jgi:regulator of replication initiation timing
MPPEPAPEILRWVKEGEDLFGQVLQTLHRFEETDGRATRLAEENERLRTEIQDLRAELGDLKAERGEVVETLKTFAEHMTRVASVLIQRLGAPHPR